ncbi:hypothetical protein RHOSPDRAFT_35988 [Rhodotorula sp. JG-1b]|nr:hypothetical protein RHOSPDRAFT_35988 [Rhodotorula sp. JG-1b]
MASTNSAEMHTAGSSDRTPANYDKAFNLAIPKPTLEHSFNWVNFTGGYFEGSWGHGEIVAGGQDAQHLMPATHPSFPLAANVSTRYLLRTHDGVFIQVQTRGWRTGPKEVLQRLSDAAREGFTGEAPQPTEYKFRLEIEMETDARNEKYAWLNTAMWIGAGVRSGRQVLYDAYLVQ